MQNSGRSEDNIHNDYYDYRALKRKIDNPDSRHDDDDIRRMKDLHDVYLVGHSIRRRQNKINAARKVASAAAASAATAAAAAATSNVPCCKYIYIFLCHFSGFICIYFDQW